MPAGAVSVPMDREVLHVLPQEFVVDGKRGIPDPVGMYGVRLEANVHVVTGAVLSQTGRKSAIDGKQFCDFTIKSRSALSN